MQLLAFSYQLLAVGSRPLAACPLQVSGCGTDLVGRAYRFPSANLLRWHLEANGRIPGRVSWRPFRISLGTLFRGSCLVWGPSSAPRIETSAQRAFQACTLGPAGPRHSLRPDRHGRRNCQHSHSPCCGLSYRKNSRNQPHFEPPAHWLRHGWFRFCPPPQKWKAPTLGELLGRLRLCSRNGDDTFPERQIKNANCAQEPGCTAIASDAT